MYWYGFRIFTDYFDYNLRFFYPYRTVRFVHMYQRGTVPHVVPRALSGGPRRERTRTRGEFKSLYILRLVLGFDTPCLEKIEVFDNYNPQTK